MKNTYEAIVENCNDDTRIEYKGVTSWIKDAVLTVLRFEDNSTATFHNSEWLVFII